MATQLVEKIAAEKYLRLALGGLDDKDGEDEGEESEEDLELEEVLGLTDLMFHTPTKSTPPKNRFMTSKPDNARFREELLAADDDDNVRISE